MPSVSPQPLPGSEDCSFVTSSQPFLHLLHLLLVSDTWNQRFHLSLNDVMCADCDKGASKALRLTLHS